MKTLHPLLSRCLIVAAICALAAGCAGPATTHANQPLVAADYEQVYVTGSHIPVLVPKSPTARRVPGISPLGILTPDEIRRASGPAPFPMH